MKEIHLEVTLQCPFNCVHCSGFAKLSHEHIDFAIIKNRLKKLQSIKKRIADLVITGGEPTTRNDLPEILEYARTFSKNLSLFTTGSNGKSTPVPVVSNYECALDEKYHKCLCRNVSENSIPPPNFLLYKKGIW